MNDYTASVVRLQDAYGAMQIARKIKAEEVKARYARIIREETKRAQEAVEIEFARELAQENARGLPGSVIREQVLRTQDWGRWKKWRDLAEIEPDRVTTGKAREARNTYWEWSDSFQTMTVFATPNGPLPEHVVYTVTPETLTHEITGKLRIPSVVNDEWVESRAWKLWGNRTTYTDAIMSEIQARIDAGDVTWK